MSEKTWPGVRLHAWRKIVIRFEWRGDFEVKCCITIDWCFEIGNKVVCGFQRYLVRDWQCDWWYIYKYNNVLASFDLAE